MSDTKPQEKPEDFKGHDVVGQDHEGHGHPGPTIQVYLVIFGALCVFTALSFLFNWLHRTDVISLGTSVTLIVLVAIVKATLVGMFFMHLKYDWLKLYYLVFPVVILTFMMIVVLLPDVVFAWKPVNYKLYHDTSEEPQKEASTH